MEIGVPIDKEDDQDFEYKLNCLKEGCPQSLFTFDKTEGIVYVSSMVSPGNYTFSLKLEDNNDDPQE